PPMSKQLTSNRYYPCLLCSCPTGQERKARAELKDLVVAALEDEGSGSDSDDGGDDLEAELSKLRKRGRRGGGAAGVDAVETGISGLVAVFFRRAERVVVAASNAVNLSKEEAKTEEEEEEEKEPSAPPEKKKKVEVSTTTPAPAPAPAPAPPHHPPTVPNSVASHIISSVTSASGRSSRFLLRLIPLQSTCYVDLGELVAAAGPVIERMVASAATSKVQPTFEILVKKRMCDSAALERSLIITAIASLVPEPFKVDLKAPRFTILIECFKNTAGVGLVEGYREQKKMNLQELRDEAAAASS
ncbi:hypothetical protein TeGR_g14052, partial [Tetraparma gracilis]